MKSFRENPDGEENQLETRKNEREIFALKNMNTITAQGAPNSLIRKFQDNPQLGVDLLKALKDLVDEVKLDFPENEFVDLAKHAIQKAEGKL